MKNTWKGINILNLNNSKGAHVTQFNNNKDMVDPLNGVLYKCGPHITMIYLLLQILETLAFLSSRVTHSLLFPLTT